MPARTLFQKYFCGTLNPYHQNTLLYATVALTRCASLTLTSIGLYLLGSAQVKNKIKRVDRLSGNTSLHEDIPLIFRNIVSLLTRQFSSIATVTACSYNDCYRCGTSPRRAYHGFPMPFPVLSW